MENKIERFIKVYPWYAAITGDMLFYISINTLFLSLEKGLSAAQIVSLSTVSSIICLIIRFPLLKVIHKIGNTISSRLSAVFLLIAAVLKTFAPNYYGILVGNFFYELYLVFHSVVVVALLNNLEIVGRKQDFIRLRTRGTTFYSVITMIIAFIVGPIFNFNHYLPMYCAIVTCAIGFFLSFFMVDFSPYNKVASIKEKEKVKVNFGKFLILVTVSYGFFYALVGTGQSECKLFIQENLLKDFSVDKASLILTIIIAASRVVRVASNILFLKLYQKTKDRVGIVLTFMLCASIAFVLFGAFIPNLIIKIFAMGMGYTVILFLRDPFRLYIQDVVFDNTPKEQHQTMLTTLAVAVKVAKTAMNTAFTLILLKFPLVVVVSVILIFTVVEAIISLILYKKIIKIRLQKV